jgi:hypothetical protein
MGGVAVVILAILALVGVLPVVLAAIAGIVFGLAFIVEGASLAARQSAAIAEAVVEESDLDIGGGVTVELVCGLAATVLGILALIGVSTPILIAALVIVGGAGLVFSAGAVQQLSLRPQPVVADGVARIAISSATTAHVLAGMSAIVLGILALTHLPAAAVLSVVGLLVLGGSLTLSGTALSSLMLRLFQRT